MKFNDEVIRKILEVDKLNLDSICETQPSLFYELTKKLPDLWLKQATLKSKLSEIKSDLYIEYKKNSEKVTEKNLEALIFSDERYKQAEKEYLEARAEYLQADLLKEAMLQRKDSIKILADLYASEYFSIYAPEAVKQQSEKAKSKYLDKLGEEIKNKFGGER